MDEDIREVRYGVSWEEFEQFLADKNDSRIPRVAYLDGVLELMTPSKSHEKNGWWIGALLTVYAEEHDIALSAFGGWTQKDELKRAGAEPDACFVLAEDHESVLRPDLVIEVQWSRANVSKLEIYRRLGIQEVWFWDKPNVLSVHVIRDGDFVRVQRSACLPDLDLVELCSFLDRPSMTRATREYRAALTR
jgi:Uma2 family endonuclease